MSNKENKLAVTHNGVEIIYDERDNRWRFTLRGRERYAESLFKARDAIDTPPDPKKEGLPFKRVQCYLEGYGGGTRVVTVTSVIATGYRGSYRYREEGGSGTNTESGTRLYPVTEETTAKFEQVKALRLQATQLAEEARKIILSATSLAKLEEAEKKA